MALATSAKYLSAKVYPFGGLEEFEALRALALQDLAAAGTRLLLRKKSSTRSVVRVYYGPPGTGKTLSAVREAVKLMSQASTIKETRQRLSRNLTTTVTSVASSLSILHFSTRTLSNRFGR